MFGNRKTELLQIIKEQMGKLTDSAKTYYSSLHEILVEPDESEEN
jgi:hypothetical protein